MRTTPGLKRIAILAIAMAGCGLCGTTRWSEPVARGVIRATSVSNGGLLAHDMTVITTNERSWLVWGATSVGIGDTLYVRTGLSGDYKGYSQVGWAQSGVWHFLDRDAP